MPNVRRVRHEVRTLLVRTITLIALPAIGLLASCSVFDASLVPPDGPGDGSTCSPTAAEVCNGVDDNCDNVADEDIDLDTDEANCGGCGNVCTFLHAAGECTDGVCVNECESGWKDCNDSTLDGCESDLASRSSCGDCGLTCP